MNRIKGDNWKVLRIIVRENIELEENNIFLDKQSGKDFTREKYLELKSKLRTKMKDLPKDFSKLYKQWKGNKISAVQFANLLGLKSRTTLYKYIKIYEG